jgi:peptidoglycan hydrolase-like protein with peptidoglycan-binding domain
MRTGTRVITAVAGLLLVSAAGLVLWHIRGTAARAGGTPTPVAATSTVAVTRGDVTQRVQISGTLGYDGRYTVIDQLPPGILTSLATPGGAVLRGMDLFAVSGTAAVLLYGAMPAYRPFAAGMGDGADVRELEENLVALGMDPAHAISVDNHFTAATAGAIARWQAALGLPAARRTGTIPLGQVVFLPGAVRPTASPVDVGASVAPGVAVLSATSTSHVVTAELTTDRQGQVHVGDQVLVSLPGATPVTGTVQVIGRVAGAPSAGPGGGPPTVQVTVAVQLPAGAGDLDQVPVQVAITTARHAGVLLIPVTALLARPGGGYQVRVLDPAPAHLVEVNPGLYDDITGSVEVSGSDIAEGARVEVPAS